MKIDYLRLLSYGGTHILKTQITFYTSYLVYYQIYIQSIVHQGFFPQNVSLSQLHTLRHNKYVKKVHCLETLQDLFCLFVILCL